MRIQRAQHADDRRLENVVVVELLAVDILFLNELQRFVEVALNGGELGILRGPRPASHRASIERTRPLCKNKTRCYEGDNQ